MHTGAFALLLVVDHDGEPSSRHIPVVIGAAEAQSIAIFIERVDSPRPMTHDLFCSFAQAFGVRLQEVFIYKFEDGIYSSEMTFSDGERTVVLDSRTSDAIAVAMRTGAPIYTTPEIVETCGIDLHEVDEIDEDDETDEADEAVSDDDSEISELFPDEDLSSIEDLASIMESEMDEDLFEDDSDAVESPEDMSIEQLERRLRQLVENEEYEEAGRLRELIKQRRSQSNADNAE